MSRISSYFQALAGRKALIPFIMAGDPHPTLTVALMHALVAGGADIVELGVPFSDPMADGPVIQRAAARALCHNVSLTDVLAMVADFRRANTHTPVVLMGYLNPLMRLGYSHFAEAAVSAGVDGVLMVDCPPEESAALVEALQHTAIDPIFLLAPTTPAARIATIVQQARGFLYYVSLNGVTGALHLSVDDVAKRLAMLRQSIRLPLAVGFGVRNAATAKALATALATNAEAIVVGSCLVQEIESASVDTVEKRLIRLVAELKAAIGGR